MKQFAPCQEKADSVGIQMTPILVVDGQVEHHGSVPSLEHADMVDLNEVLRVYFIIN
ncbi:MAG: thioredoxin family protein [Pseudomonadota bacterium]